MSLDSWSSTQFFQVSTSHDHSPQRIVVEATETALLGFTVNTNKLFGACHVFLYSSYSKSICFMWFYLFLVLICILFGEYVDWWGFMQLLFSLGYLEFSISSFNSLNIFGMVLLNPISVISIIWISYGPVSIVYRLSYFWSYSLDSLYPGTIFFLSTRQGI